jgi:hypothetical protein
MDISSGGVRLEESLRWIVVVRSVGAATKDCHGGHAVCTVSRFGRIFAVKRFAEARKSSVFFVTLYRAAGNR